MVQQHARGQSGRRRRQHHDALQPPRPVGERHKGLCEPFVCEPAAVACGKGKRVGRRDGVVIQDTIAGTDLPKRVAVIQIGGRNSSRAKIRQPAIPTAPSRLPDLRWREDIHEGNGLGKAARPRHTPLYEGETQALSRPECARRG